MSDITWFSTLSTVAAALAIAIGAMLPALAMGRAIAQALEALARQPEAERAITRTLFIGLAMIESLTIYVLVVVLIILFRNPLLEYLLKLPKGSVH
jgi:F-type H+-transporting ATPase subunit c